MGNGQDPDRLIVDDVSDVVGELRVSGVEFAEGFAYRPGTCGSVFDSFGTSGDFFIPSRLGVRRELPGRLRNVDENPCEFETLGGRKIEAIFGDFGELLHGFKMVETERKARS